MNTSVIYQSKSNKRTRIQQECDALDQGCPNSFLEGHCPAEFSSN